jgi:co-chaperonin GroES (HSP10)
VPQAQPLELAPGEELRGAGTKVIIAPEKPRERLVHLVRGDGDEDTFVLGRIVSVGTEAGRELGPDLKVGDRVLYAQSAAAKNAVKDRHVVRWDHVLCGIAEDVKHVEARVIAHDRVARDQERVSTVAVGKWTKGRDA